MRAISKSRRGVTLLELLIVVGIMLLITSVAVTAFVPSLSSRRIRETARQIDVFLNTAKNRAMENGRETGVVFRAEPNTSTCINLQIVESPEPYAGDAYASRAWFYEPLIDSNGDGDWDTGETFHDINGNTTWEAGNDEVMMTGYFNGTNFVEDVSWQPIIQPGDSIQFNLQGASYTILPYEPFTDTNGNGVWDSTPTPEPYVDINNDGNWDDSREPITTDRNSNGQYDAAEPFIDSDNDGTHDAGEVFADVNQDGTWQDEDIYTDSNSDGIYTPCPLPWFLIWNATTTPTPAYGTGRPFQIHRRPVISSAGSLQLPEGVAVDLWASGTGVTTPLSVTGADVYDSVSNTQYDAAYGTRSIAILFNPKGDVARVYDGPNFVRPLTAVHFLVGQTIKGGVMAAGTLEQGDPAVLAAEATNGEKYSWQDQDSLWITVHPTSGLITTAENVANTEVISTVPATIGVPLGIIPGRAVAATAQGLGGR